MFPLYLTVLKKCLINHKTKNILFTNFKFNKKKAYPDLSSKLNCIQIKKKCKIATLFFIKLILLSTEKYAYLLLIICL